ncbi:hypothetical protein SAMN02910275_00793 [Butyrivibrio sp. INlla18]|uniref:hypothetical protein n=1 Tax=Butyrivibrio sp. INlla18 TaxID=1520806 RepID=UPI00087F3702|nr:hypothetical protein [Butyrivibrio sp. INlla18]SDA48920.1 hypothetical protein SAMN02910275_00793 [Butyrivibrio sp. INlla18]
MKKVRMILCGSVEPSSQNQDENVGVVSFVYVSEDEQGVKSKLEELQKVNPENFYMEYEVPLDQDLTELGHYPSIEISKEDLG